MNPKDIRFLKRLGIILIILVAWFAGAKLPYVPDKINGYIDKLDNYPSSIDFQNLNGVETKLPDGKSCITLFDKNGREIGQIKIVEDNR